MTRALLVVGGVIAGAAAALVVVWVADELDIVIWREPARYQQWREQW